jgi:hypothetical protein
MADYLTKNCSKCLLGISILNESISNFTYKLRFNHTSKFK